MANQNEGAGEVSVGLQTVVKGGRGAPIIVDKLHESSQVSGDIDVHGTDMAM
jgi:hypothetical protein